MSEREYLLRVTKRLQDRVGQLQRDKVTYREALVTAVDVDTQTFSVAVPGEQDGRDLAGIAAVPDHLPDVGDIVQLALTGPQPVHLAGKVTAALAADPVDGTPRETTRFGRTLGTRSSITGEQTSTVDEDGNATFRTMSADTVQVDGTDLASALDRYPKGLLTFWDTGKLQSGIALEFGLLETGYVLPAGRNYRLHVNAYVSPTGNDSDFYLRIRQTTNGSAPTTSSTIIAERPYTIRVGGRSEHFFFDVNFQIAPGGSSAQYRWLLTLERGPGTAGFGGTVAASYTPSSVHLFDDGAYITKAGSDATVTPKVRNVYAADASWSRSFRGDGTIRSDTTDMVQGYYSVNGDGKAMVGWPDLTTMLSGATIQSIRVRLQTYLWYYNAGGTLLLGTHSQTSAPGSFSGTTSRMSVPFGPAPSYKWIDVTAWASEFIAGTTRGFTLGPSGGTNRTYYGRFAGALDAAHPDLRPRLEIVYYK